MPSVPAKRLGLKGRQAMPQWVKLKGNMRCRNGGPERQAAMPQWVDLKGRHAKPQ
ncbi:hypothetical protein [Paenibacillus humicus]|uniref:hypothetical protein n=1 Tax=Paenibacillus humicus TaxID=412861 RepID=UPI001C3F52A8|nr:hypothetical protein [Paenibacillus humicus]